MLGLNETGAISVVQCLRGDRLAHQLTPNPRLGENLFEGNGFSKVGLAKKCTEWINETRQLEK